MRILREFSTQLNVSLRGREREVASSRSERMLQRSAGDQQREVEFTGEKRASVDRLSSVVLGEVLEAKVDYSQTGHTKGESVACESEGTAE
jgi:hypothetical protein